MTTEEIALSERLDELLEALDWSREEQCHYCGDMAHDAHRCRAGSHDFRPTGHEVVTLRREQLDELVEAARALSHPEPMK